MCDEAFPTQTIIANSKRGETEIFMSNIKCSTSWQHIQYDGHKIVRVGKMLKNSGNGCLRKTKT